MADLEFNKDLIFFDVEADSNLDALDQVSHKLFDLGYVKESYIEAVKEREKVFATGLPVEDFAVAVPHTDVEHVNKQSICVATLKKPVTFEVMAGAGEKCEVSILFMLALKEPHQQLAMLQTVISLIQQEDKLKSIYESKDKELIMKIVQDELAKQVEEA